MKKIKMTITDTGVQTFTTELQNIHHRGDHPVPTIPPKYDIADALHFIFDGVIEDISRVLQDYVDGSDDAIILVERIRKGIQLQAICMVCTKRHLRGIDKWHCYQS